MAQERKGEYNVALTSPSENKFRQGILPQGRYRGFDTMINHGGTGVNVTITHTNTGFIRNTFANPPVQQPLPFAYVITPQGIEVQTDIQAVNLSVTDLPTADTRRVDIVVLDHEYTTAQGGQSANVIIIEGTPVTATAATWEPFPNPATVSNPSKQTILGYIEVIGNPSGLTFNDCFYRMADVPNLSGKELATLNGKTIFTGAIGRIPLSISTTTIDAGYKLTLPTICSVVRITSGSTTTLKYISKTTADGHLLPTGTELDIEIHSPVKLRLSINAPIAASSGYQNSTHLVWRIGKKTTAGPGNPNLSSGGIGELFCNNRFKVRLLPKEGSPGISEWEIVDVVNNIDEQIADYAGGWRSNNTNIQLTAGQVSVLNIMTLTNQPNYLIWKNYFSCDPSQIGGAAEIKPTMMTSFMLNVSFNLGTIPGASTYLEEVNFNLNFQSIPYAALDLIVITGFAIEDPTNGSSNVAGGTRFPVYAEMLGGVFKVRSMLSGQNFSETKSYNVRFNATIPTTVAQ